MKVHELIEALRAYPADAEVLAYFQENWPLEAPVLGLVRRNDAMGAAAPVVVLGEIVGYGDRDAWKGLR